MSDNNIDSVLIEERQFPPSNEFAKNAIINQEKFDALYKAAEDDYEGPKTLGASCGKVHT